MTTPPLSIESKQAIEGLYNDAYHQGARAFAQLIQQHQALAVGQQMQALLREFDQQGNRPMAPVRARLIPTNPATQAALKVSS